MQAMKWVLVTVFLGLSGCSGMEYKRVLIADLVAAPERYDGLLVQFEAESVLGVDYRGFIKDIEGQRQSVCAGRASTAKWGKSGSSLKRGRHNVLVRGRFTIDKTEPEVIVTSGCLEEYRIEQYQLKDRYPEQAFGQYPLANWPNWPFYGIFRGLYQRYV